MQQAKSYDSLIHSLHSSKNLLMIGKSYLMLGKKPEAKEYLQRTLAYPVKTEDDREAVAEAETLLKGL